MHAYIAFVEVSGRLCIKVVAAPSLKAAILGLRAALGVFPLATQTIPLQDYQN